MLKRDKNLRALERFLFKYIDHEEVAAETMAHIVGVLIGVKEAMEGDFPPDYSDSKRFWRMKKLLDNLNLAVIFDRYQFDGHSFTRFYVATSHRRAEKLRDLFRKLSSEGWSPELHTEIGHMLGYPETAIRYFIRSDPADGMSKSRQERTSRNRFYVHSSTYEDAEFKAYEVPIYRQLQKFCPKSTKVLSSHPQTRWLD